MYCLYAGTGRQEKDVTQLLFEKDNGLKYEWRHHGCLMGNGDDENRPPEDVTFDAALNSLGEELGATVTFSGVTRAESTRSKLSGLAPVASLIIEGDEPMVLNSMQTVLMTLVDEIGTHKEAGVVIAAYMRLGSCEVGTSSISVCVKAMHRAEAFNLLQTTIDKLKYEVPTWKKERRRDGTENWVLPPMLNQDRIDGPAV